MRIVAWFLLTEYRRRPGIEGIAFGCDEYDVSELVLANAGQGLVEPVGMVQTASRAETALYQRRSGSKPDIREEFSKNNGRDPDIKRDFPSQTRL